MSKAKVTLVNKEHIQDQIKTAVSAMRTCYDSHSLSDNGGEEDLRLLTRAIEAGHHTPLEFITLTFKIENLTRAILQELVRHRSAVFNVKSTRYTLKKDFEPNKRPVYSDYFYTDLPHYNEFLDMLFDFLDENDLWNLPNDELKLYFPESLFCNLQMNINFRGFLNLLHLRRSKKAHFLIRQVADEMYNLLPNNMQNMVDTYIKVQASKT